MSWDVGATSNFGSLTFPATGGSGIAGDSISTLSIYTSTINTSTINVSSAIYLDERELQYVYGGIDVLVAPPATTTVQLPFRYITTDYQIAVNYNTIDGLTGAPLVPIPQSISSFQVFTTFTSPFTFQYITCGFLDTSPVGPPPPPPTPPTGSVGDPFINPDYPIDFNQITVFFNTFDVVSETPVTYKVKYGLTSPPVDLIDIVPFGEDLYLSQTPATLTQNTAYYFQSFASNASLTTLSSAVVSFTTISGSPTGSVGSPFIDPAYPATANSITIFVDISEVVSPVPITYNIGWGYAPGGIGFFADLQPFQTNILSAVVSGLIPSQAYYFRARGSNGLGIIDSPEVGPFSTTA